MLPIVLVIEDDDTIQGIVEDALSEGGFEAAIATTGEEAVTLLKGRLVTYRALVTDINLLEGSAAGRSRGRHAMSIPIFP
ncbi:DNA-binding response OmpR family regulator [Bradyrhizobium japonicum]